MSEPPPLPLLAVGGYAVVALLALATIRWAVVRPRPIR